ncbi:MAG TPA: hypothetical protein VLE72_01560 [Candidatus Saccharimonadales bacterium]|nr:hypothetical protein [Candidatus Saccharimonadales bacterium]
MQLVSASLIAILAMVAVWGWIRAWRLSRSPARSLLAKAEHGDSLASVEAEATASIARSIQQATELFQKNLTVQALKINDELETIAKQRLHKQIQDFSAVLDGLTTTATASVGQLQTLVEQRRQALEAGLATEIVDEKQRTLSRFYTRLNDIVASYIIDSLGNDIDLSGQLPFVLKTLEDNKALIKQDLLSDH